MLDWARPKLMIISWSCSFDSILITDSSPEGKIIYANNAFSQLTGYPVDEVVGKAPKILQARVRACV